MKQRNLLCALTVWSAGCAVNRHISRCQTRNILTLFQPGLRGYEKELSILQARGFEDMAGAGCMKYHAVGLTDRRKSRMLCLRGESEREVMWTMKGTRALHNWSHKNMAHISPGNLSFLVMLDLPVNLVEYLFRKKNLSRLKIIYLVKYLPWWYVKQCMNL